MEVERMKVRRKIIKIDEERCTGCRQCVLACAEGAIEIINGKARLVNEAFCDGLGVCLSECPEGALTIEEREVEEFQQGAVEDHPAHISSKEAEEPLPCGCPGSSVQELATPGVRGSDPGEEKGEEAPSALGNWPVQLRLVPPDAPYLRQTNLLISADCVPFAYAGFHRRFLDNHTLLIGCPKLDDTRLYEEKLAQIFSQNDIRSIDILYMEVPCCYGLVQLVRLAQERSGKDIPITLTKIGIRGKVCDSSQL